MYIYIYIYLHIIIYVYIHIHTYISSAVVDVFEKKQEHVCVTNIHMFSHGKCMHVRESHWEKAQLNFPFKLTRQDPSCVYVYIHTNTHMVSHGKRIHLRESSISHDT
jgi:hypothetical protein